MTRTLQDEREKIVARAYFALSYAGSWDRIPEAHAACFLAAKAIIAADPYTAEVERLQTIARDADYRRDELLADNQRLTGLLAEATCFVTLAMSERGEIRKKAVDLLCRIGSGGGGS